MDTWAYLLTDYKLFILCKDVPMLRITCLIVFLMAGVF